MTFRPALLTVLFLTIPIFAAPDAPPVMPRAGETIDVSIVDFDVIVTDSHGKRVHGLTRDDFEVFEDRKPQAITNFAAYANESQQREKRTIVLFIERSFDVRFRVEPTYAAIKETLNEIVAPGDSVTIATWNGGPVIALAPTDDLRAIDNTLDEIARASMTGPFRMSPGFPAIDNPFPAILDMIPIRRDDRLGYEIQAGAYAYSVAADEVRDEAAAVNSLINALGDEGGRKAFLLMTRNIGPTSRADYFYTIERRTESRWRDYYRNSEIIDTIKASAAARNVPIYAFPPGPPLSFGNDPWSNHGPDPYINLQIDKVAALRDIARTSGGAFATGTDIVKAMTRVRDDLSDYYSLAYRVPARNDNRVRNVVVKTKNPEYTVRTRRQYIEKNDDVRVRDRVIASLFTPTGPSGISVDAVIGNPVAKGRRHTSVPVSLVVPASSFMTTADKGAFSIYIATGHDIGRASDIEKRTVSFTSADLTRAPDGKVEYRFDLVTDPDANLLSVGVYDELSHDSGFARVDLPKVRR
jgi:VWFA-related protein